MLRIAGPRAVGSRLFLIVAPLLAGCADRDSSTTLTVGTENQPRASVALRVLVVNEPELAEAINRLRGEWAERSGGELSASGTAWKKLAEQKAIEADVIVCPSRYLGELCVRDWLRPVRPNVLESNELNVDDIFPLVRRELMRWGGEVMTLPLGIDPATLRPDRREQPGVTLLVEAVRGSSDNRDSVLFDIERMNPRITESAFISALERLQQSSDESGTSSGAEVAIPVVGFGDRLIAVSRASRNAASAFKLLAWLGQADTSTQLAQVGGMLPVRLSLASSPDWYGSEVSADDRIASGKALERLLSGQRCLVVPRIPNVDEYMAALDEAVKRTLSREATPEEALQGAAQRWEEITEARGRDVQRDAYLNHLGIRE